MTQIQEEFNEFLEQQKQEEYNLGDITGTPEGDMIKYTELKIAVNQEQEQIKAFEEYYTGKFKELDTKFHEDEDALREEKKTQEALGYIIPSEESI